MTQKGIFFKGRLLQVVPDQVLQALAFRGRKKSGGPDSQCFGDAVSMHGSVHFLPNVCRLLRFWCTMYVCHVYMYVCVCSVWDYGSAPAPATSPEFLTRFHSWETKCHLNTHKHMLW